MGCKSAARRRFLYGRNNAKTKIVRRSEHELDVTWVDDQIKNGGRFGPKRVME